MKRTILSLAMLCLALPAQAQEATAKHCNAAAVYDTAILGNLKIVTAPSIGGIYVCGFIFGSTTTATLGVKLTYSTAGVVTTGPAGGTVTGAVFNTLTPGFTFISSTTSQFLVDSSAEYKGIFVPQGNQLNVTTSVATGPVTGMVYYWTQNP